MSPLTLFLSAVRPLTHHCQVDTAPQVTADGVRKL